MIKKQTYWQERTGYNRGNDKEDNTYRRPRRTGDSRESYRKNDTCRSGKNCSRCDSIHELQRCSAFGKRCIRCQKLNHFAKACRMRKVQGLDTKTFRGEDEESVFLMNKLTNEEMGKTLETLIEIEGVEVKFRLDTGAQANVLPYVIWEQLPPTTLKQRKNTLMTYTRQPVTLVGECVKMCQK